MPELPEQLVFGVPLIGEVLRDDAVTAHLDCLWLGEGLVTGELRHFDHPMVFHKGLGLRSDGFNLVTLE